MFFPAIVSSPLEQFEVFSIFCFQNTIIDWVFFFFFFFLMFTVSYFFFFDFLVPSFFSNIFNKIFYFLYNIFLENLGIQYIYFFPFIFFFFLFFLFANVIGMIPFVFTITSHFCVTFSIAFMILFSATFMGILKHGANFCNLFIPHGCPLVIVPFLILIELISYFARMFSLSIRLFANMMSGHTLLHILAKFSWNLVFLGVFGAVFLVLPFGFLSIITLLELAIAFLQAYVFTVLFIIYLNDALNLH